MILEENDLVGSFMWLLGTGVIVVREYWNSLVVMFVVYSILVEYPIEEIGYGAMNLDLRVVSRIMRNMSCLLSDYPLA